MPGQESYVLPRKRKFTIPHRGGTAVLMRRQLARFLFVFVIGIAAMVLGVITSMTLTPPGRDLLARTSRSCSTASSSARSKVGSISGSFLYDLTLENLVVRDTSGALLADLPRVRVSYRLPNFIAGQVVLSAIQLDRPTIQLIKHRNGRMNYEEVLGIGKGQGREVPAGRVPQRADDGRDAPHRAALESAESARTEGSVDSALAGRAGQAGPDRSRRAPRDCAGSSLLADLDHPDVPAPYRHTGPPAVHHRPRLARHPGQRSRGDAPPRGGPSPDPGRQRGVQSVPGRAAGHPVLRRRRGHLAARHHPLRLPGHRAPGQPGGPALGFPRLSLDDRAGVLTARSETGARTAYDIRDLHLARAAGQVDGDLVTITDRRRGLGVRDMSLRLADSISTLSAPIWTRLPFYGTVTGKLAGSGSWTRMDLQNRVGLRGRGGAG